MPVRRPQTVPKRVPDVDFVPTPILQLKAGQRIEHNRFGFGRSVEVENDDGTEFRTKEKIKLVQKTYYLRLWIGKIVLVISRENGLKIVHKKRYNFKIVFGIKGLCS